MVEKAPAQFPSLPRWPAHAEPIDTTGTSFLIFAIGGGVDAKEVAARWTAQAETRGPTTLAVLDAVDDPVDLAAFGTAMARARTGVRVMVVGGQFDVLQALSILRQSGALETEMRCFVTDHSEIPVFCAHCQHTFRAVAATGGRVSCASCARNLNVHEHMAALTGRFLASDADASTL